MQFLAQLESLKKRERSALAKYFEPFSAEAEEILFYEGDKPEGLYFIEEGSVEEYFVFNPKRGATLPPLLKGPGDFLGETVLLGINSPATSVIIDTVKGKCLKSNKLAELKTEKPELILALTTAVFQRAHLRRNSLIYQLGTTLDRQKALMEVSQGLNSPFMLDSLLHNIWVFAIQFTSAERCTIFVIDEEKGDLYSRILHDEKIEEIRLPLGKGIAGYVAQTGEVINLDDAYSSELFNPEIDKKSGFHTRNILTVPMRNPDGKLIGAIQVLNKKNGAFTREDEDFLQSMGVHASLAIQRTLLTKSMAEQESLAAIGNFSAGIIHDIKNPLTVIKGYSELLGMTHDDPKVRKYMDTIQSQIQRLLSMIQEVLDFSHGVVRIEKTENDAVEFFKNLLSTFDIKLQERNAELKQHFARDKFIAFFDREKMMRVVINLITNSLEAMKEGGTITVNVDADDKNWFFTIEDSGVGISADRLPKIFDKFHSHGKKNGTGLGLAITKQIVEAHDGKITVESTENVGSIFKVTLPVKK